MQKIDSLETQPREDMNTYPQILFVKLEGTQRKKKLFGTFEIDDKNRIDLSLVLRFGKYLENIPLGSVTFGLKGGHLKLSIKNGKIPTKSCYPNQLFDNLEVEIQTEQGKENQFGVEVSNSQKDGISGKGIFGGKQLSKQSQKVKFSASQVTISGTEENPTWTFNNRKDNSTFEVFEGQYSIPKLGILQILQRTCEVEARFEVSLKDIYVTDASGLYSPNMDRDSQVVLDRAIANLFLKHRLGSYLSKVYLQFN
ncbi:hypothetical protein B9G53_24505 [Pseudanabaena sp. SR411]|uniref:hypothetical protein n=1 Tax=Pseudanabaena sp. SR411 TaxID=1980935 RepID=UPI000B99C023|nr:hypothetical protein [Pseudanabaena sp. SR411]OYQ61987.1 hypothetical protein B9G53_24505 [Pseudanabaena sp. SR411]